jgi:hypothetical protein
MEHWDYLDTILPDIYPGSPDSDIELIKNQLSAFVDTFLSLIDKDNGESVSADEFERVQVAMQKAKLTSVTTMKSPKDEFLSKITEALNGNQADHVKVLKEYFEALKLSKWLTSYSLKYSNNASRYMSISIGRRQVGSLVSLKSRPMMLRMKGKFDFAKKLLADDYSGLVLQEQLPDSSLTGFGELIIDFQSIAKSKNHFSPDQMLGALNLLYDKLIVD